MRAWAIVVVDRSMLAATDAASGVRRHPSCDQRYIPRKTTGIPRALVYEMLPQGPITGNEGSTAHLQAAPIDATKAACSAVGCHCGPNRHLPLGRMQVYLHRASNAVGYAEQWPHAAHSAVANSASDKLAIRIGCALCVPSVWSQGKSGRPLTSERGSIGPLNRAAQR